MKITSQLIRRKAKQSSLQSILYLNLSGLGISVLEKLNSCTRLQSLDISHNCIESITTNIEHCHQLWSFNVSGNKLKCLDGLGRFVAIGSLDLSNNQLTWSELAKIQHLHILELRLHGNMLLEKDPYYRTHVIDCLPNVWMLDGRLITSAERIQVKAFFDDSAVSDRPVRHKLSSSKGFVPSAHKTREVDGIFGDKVIHMMRRFPKQDAINIDLDRRRLAYLAENIAQDIILHTQALQSKHESLPISETFLVELLEARKQDALRCNMFIMLLLTSMEFHVPNSLFVDTMQLMKLDKFGNVNAMEVFTLSHGSRALITGVLLSAVKVERVDKQTGGLYDKLYLSMNYLLTESIKACSGAESTPNSLYRQYKTLLAAEVVLLMCYVPSFAEYMQKEPGVMSLVTTATSDSQVINNVATLKAELDKQNVSRTEQIKALGQFIQSAVMFNLAKSPEKPPKPQSQDQKVFSKRPLPKRPMSGPVFSSTYHMKGRTSPDRNPPRVTSAKPQRPRTPEMSRQEYREEVWNILVSCDVGETVLTSPQCLARIVSLPQPDIALVLLEMIPVNGAMHTKAPTFEEQYAYIDTKELLWDAAKSYWKPRGTVGNRVTLHYVKQGEIAKDSPHIGYAEVQTCHHSAGGRVTPINSAGGRITPITVPLPTAGNESGGLVVDTDISPDRFSVSPHQVGSGPAPSPAQSPPLPSEKPELTVEATELSKMSLNEGNVSSNNNDVEDVPVCEPPPPSPPASRTPKQLSVIEIGTDVLPARLTPSPSTHDLSQGQTSPAAPLPSDNNTNMAPERTAASPDPADVQTAPAAAPPKEDTAEPPKEDAAELPAVLDASAEFVEDNSESDEDELSALAREDLIRDTLSNTDLDMSISERHIAPSNSPDMRLGHSSVNSQTPSRQPSTSINSVYKMLRAEETYKASARHKTVGYAESRPHTPHLRNRAQEWDLKIFDPDCTPNVSVKWANLWMGGGRDLHSEEMRKRPNSAHVPGWREGLKGTPRTRSAHTTRYASTGKLGNGRPRQIHSSQGHSTYDQQLSHQQYKFLPHDSNYRRTFLSTRDNMRDKKQLIEVQRELAWTEYVKNAMLHRGL